MIPLFGKVCLSVFAFNVWDELWVLIRPVPEFSCHGSKMEAYSGNGFSVKHSFKNLVENTCLLISVFAS